MALIDSRAARFLSCPCRHNVYRNALPCLHSIQVSVCSRRSCRAPARRFHQLCAQAESLSDNDQHSEHVFGQKGYVAGIPISSKATPCGLRLRHTLQHRPHEFVDQALLELQAAVEQLTQQHGQHEAQLLPESDGSSAQHLAEKAEVLEDVIYHWALAEAYVHHPQMQTYMRAALGRPASPRPLAAGDDNMLLASRVQLLHSPLYEGQYMIGSVRFSCAPPADQSTRSSGWDADRSSSNGESSTSGRLDGGGIRWGGGGRGSTSPAGEIIPALEAVFGTERARLMTSVRGDALSRMDREGAARTFHTFMYCGYFNRRMKLRASRPGDQYLSPLLAAVFTPERHHGAGSLGPQLPGPTKRYHAEGQDESAITQSGYGEVAPVWRFFEQVPSNISSPQTMQAASVAQRHLRALFGSTTECITTLQAWQEMCTEARWFGRALYDAEQLVLSTCCRVEQELSSQA